MNWPIRNVSPSASHAHLILTPLTCTPCRPEVDHPHAARGVNQDGMVSRDAFVGERELTRLGAPTRARLLCNRQAVPPRPSGSAERVPRGEKEQLPAPDSRGSSRWVRRTRTPDSLGPHPAQPVGDRQTDGGLVQASPGPWVALALPVKLGAALQIDAEPRPAIAWKNA